MQKHDDDDALLTPAEVARMFRVSPKTVTRWARAGKLTAMRTLGGHRRFRAQRCAGSSGASKSPATPKGRTTSFPSFPPPAKRS